MKLTSPAFGDGPPIPARYTCDGENVSPELRWSDVPDDTSSLALTCEDPDAPRGTFTHWVIWNLDPTEGGIPAGDVPKGARQGRNDFGHVGYGGPCPPIGNHRYFFKLYALDTVLPDLKRPTKAKLEEAMRGHIIATAELIGLYQKQHQH